MATSQMIQWLSRMVTLLELISVSIEVRISSLVSLNLVMVIKRLLACEIFSSYELVSEILLKLRLKSINYTGDFSPLLQLCPIHRLHKDLRRTRSEPLSET